MSWHDALGFLAAAMTSSAFVPQVWLTFRTRDVSGISLTMYSVFTVGVALWLAYGITLKAWPIVVANMFTLTMSAAILTMKCAWGGKSKSAPTHVTEVSD